MSYDTLIYRLVKFRNGKFGIQRFNKAKDEWINEYSHPDYHEVSKEYERLWSVTQKCFGKNKEDDVISVISQFGR